MTPLTESDRRALARAERGARMPHAFVVFACVFTIALWGGILWALL